MPLVITLPGLFFPLLPAVKIPYLSSDLVQRMEQESSASAGGIQNTVRLLDRQAVYNKADNISRCKILPEIPAEKGSHKGLKRTPFAVQIRVLQINSFKVADHCSHLCRVQFDPLSENLRIIPSFILAFSFFIKIGQTPEKILAGLFICFFNILLCPASRLCLNNLEVIRLPVPAHLIFIVYLAEDEQWFDSFDKSVWRYVTYEGEIYALPLENIYAAMFVNVDLLNRYGLGIPATYEDWKKMIPVLKAEGIIPIAFNLSDNELMLYQAIVAKLGGRFYSDDIEKNGAYNEYYAAAAEYLKELYQLGAFPDNLFSITENESEELFLQKKAAFIVQDSHFVTNIQNIDDGSTKICYMPSFENERSSERSALYGLGKNNLFVSAKSMESKEEYVIRFLKYMTSREVATKLKDELGALSAVNPNENMYLGNIAYVNSEFTYSLTETVHFISNYNDNGKWNKIVERMPSYLESRIDVWTLLE